MKILSFVDATNAELVKFLYENERISDEAIVAAFKKASGWGLQYWRFTFDANRTEIVKLLHEDSRIPGEVLGEALVRAANAGHAGVVALLCHDTRISDELRGKAFAEASTCENSDLMLSLYDKQRAPPASISTALCDADKTPHLKRLVQLVFTDDEVPRERKRRIIAGAVELGCKRIQQTLHDCGVEDWSLAAMDKVG
ncbi:hypothetical protein PHYSODRAFT_332683 [Phytophthora sojae]|uniref:Ankyrin repeat protein n=1 Tax=Phytophthora sojae (strain P6497) TaxID=1094619 RepID=G4ZD17_PHYSP|nr:hypothetical protein PHYSODRAFT_332683 [Phytophthora sojae]EGZ18965.1 hypothetical protein PHYSODRAFT_332683 [Phytophthora sojae]|eukprot:XP_009528023.1 hypothetical protein PHYSODRAFT_332683 [Phytophthora sojae]